MTTRQMPWPAVLTDTEDVRHPPREYGILLFWFLNGELDPVEMRLQLREFRDKGMPGIILHECYGLEIPYLGEETSLERINFTLYPFIGNRDRPDRPDIHAIRRDHSASGTPLGHLRLGLAVMGRDGAPAGDGRPFGIGYLQLQPVGLRFDWAERHLRMTALTVMSSCAGEARLSPAWKHSGRAKAAMSQRHRRLVSVSCALPVKTCRERRARTGQAAREIEVQADLNGHRLCLDRCRCTARFTARRGSRGQPVAEESQRRGNRSYGDELMTTNRLRVAIIGCGHIAQWMHIPYLRELDDRYEIAAACDISAKLVERVGEYFQIPARYTDYQKLLDEAHPDVCLITTLDHYPPALASIEAGAHVLVEKPMCLLLAEAEHLAARAEELGRVVQVGYHKRYDPNYQRGLALMRDISQRRLLYLRCVIGPNARYNNDFWPGWRYDDLPPLPSVNEKIRSGLGGDLPDNFVAAYSLMGGLSTHTFSIFRGLYPEVPTVHGCHISADGRSYSALMETSDGVTVTMDTGVIDVKSFDEEMSLFAHNDVVKINFPSPYLKNAETHVMSVTMNGDERVEQHFLASNEEAYKREWKAFYESVVNGAPVLTPAREGVMDVQLNLRLLEAARRSAASRK